MAGSVAFGHKVQRIAWRRHDGCLERVAPRHGNGCGRQTFAGVSVPRVVGAQVNAAQVAVKAVKHAVNHGGVRLQRHVNGQTVMKHTADGGAVAFAARLFFDDAGQNERFIDGFDLNIRLALAPSRSQLFGHGVGSALHHMQLRGAFAVGVGVWEESAFGCHTRHTELSHERFITQTLGVMFEAFGLGQGGAKLAKRPAINQADGFEAFLAAAEFAKQVQGRFALCNFIAPRSQCTRLTTELEKNKQKLRVDLNASSHRGFGNASHCGLRFDGKVNNLAFHGQRPIHPIGRGG